MKKDISSVFQLNSPSNITDVKNVMQFLGETETLGPENPNNASETKDLKEN